MNAPLPGLFFTGGLSREPDRVEIATHSSQLRRILAFAGWSIDDVVNNPLARRDVQRWFKIGRWMQREIEIGDLERQWNPLK